MARVILSLLNLVITVLVIANLGAGAYLAMRIVQIQQDKTPEEIEVSSIEQSTPIPPTTTPIPPSPTPIPLLDCTAEQRQQIVDVTAAFNERAEGDSSDPELPDDATVQEFSKYLLEFEQFHHIYRTEYYPQFPTCLDGYILRDYLDLVYDAVVEYLVLASLTIYVLQFGDQSISDIIREQLDKRETFTNEFLDAVDITDILLQDNLFTLAEITCGDRAPAELAKFDPFLEEYRALFPAYQDFMATQTGDFATLFRFDQLALEVFELEGETCIENYDTELIYVQLFQDTTLVVHLSQLASFEEKRGEAATGAGLRAIVAERHARVLKNVELLN